MINVNFKSIAEKCLKKDISGHFILRSGGTLHSNRLQKFGFYNFKNWEYFYNETGICVNGKPEWDIIDFNIDMNNDKRTIQISLQQAREWYNSGNDTLKTLALSSFSKEEIDPYPRSWSEYLKNHPGLLLSLIAPEPMCSKLMAYSKLLLLRREWIHIWSQEQGLEKDWEPDYNYLSQHKYYIYFEYDVMLIGWANNMMHPLSFPTRELAENFLNTFKNLLEEAKSLY